MLGKFIHSAGTATSLGRWVDLIDPAASPFQDVEPERAFLEGSLVRREIDRTNVDLIEVRATRHTITRTLEHIRQTPERLCMVTVQRCQRHRDTPGLHNTRIRARMYRFSTFRDAGITALLCIVVGRNAIHYLTRPRVANATLTSLVRPGFAGSSLLRDRLTGEQRMRIPPWMPGH